MNHIPHIEQIRHAWPEPGVFSMRRPYGCSNYVFLHFWNAMEITLHGERIVTEPHACILYASGTPQFFASEHDIVHDWMHMEGDVAAFATEYDIPLDTVLYPQKYTFITDIMRELEQEYFVPAVYNEPLCAAKLTELFIRLRREIVRTPGVTPVNEQTAALLQKLRRRMCCDFSENWTVEKMAASIGISASYLHAAYKNYYHISPTADLIAIRMERARMYLTGTEKTVAELAAMLGYANTTHFIRQFTAQIGVSPLKYRKMHMSARAE